MVEKDEGVERSPRLLLAWRCRGVSGRGGSVEAAEIRAERVQGKEGMGRDASYILCRNLDSHDQSIKPS